MLFFTSSTKALTPPQTAESEIAAKRPAAKRGHAERRRGVALTLIEPDSAVGCYGCVYGCAP
jgi:hypothetical protein